MSPYGIRLFVTLYVGFSPFLAVAQFLCAGGRPVAEDSVAEWVAAKLLQPQALGTRRAIVLFAHFLGEQPEQAIVPAWAAGIFDREQPGSFSHSYAAMSFGQLQIDGAVAPQSYGSLQAPSVYLATDPAEEGRFGLFCAEILEQADRDIDFARFDNDGPDGLPDSGDDDGVVDVVFLNLASVPPHFLLGNATGIATLGLETDFVTDDLGVNGQPIRIATNQGTLQQGRTFVETVGTMCHEYGHVLGLPDLYDTAFLQTKDPGEPANDSAGIGAWGLMGWGVLGWHGDDGPTSFSGWSRMRLGWTAVEEVAGQRQEVRLTDVGIGGAVVKIPLDFGEYFLLEHRRTRTYYDRHVPGEGLLIWHVGNSWIDLECADGRWRDKGYPLGQQVDPARGEDNLDFWAHDRAYRSAHQGNLGDSTDVFDGIRFTAFTPQTNPASFRVDGHLSVRVEQIRWEQEQMWAEVDAPFIIQNLRLRSPADMEALIGFEGRALAIAGFLTVNGSSLLNLEGLNGLRVVDRDVWIDDNPALMSLEGLNELTRIGGDLVLSNNETLANLGALKQLRVVNRDVQINYNPELMSLEGLNRLTQVGGDLVFLNNETLISLEGLNRLTQVGDDLVLRDNETLTSLEGLNRLTQVGGDLVIIGNPRLTSLEGLRQLPQVEGNLIITGNSPHLTNSLIQNYPNPFNRGTMIRLDLLRSQDVDLALYNITGQRITSLINGYREAGTYILHWDGRDAQGQALASGVYLYRLRTRRQVETRKLLLLR